MKMSLVSDQDPSKTIDGFYCLWSAVLVTAIRDFQNRRKLKPIKKIEIENWFLDEKPDQVGSLDWILNILGLMGSKEQILNLTRKATRSKIDLFSR